MKAGLIVEPMRRLSATTRIQSRCGDMRLEEKHGMNFNETLRGAAAFDGMKHWPLTCF